jgi:hypothetical protein
MPLFFANSGRKDGGSVNKRDMSAPDRTSMEGNKIGNPSTNNGRGLAGHPREVPLHDGGRAWTCDFPQIRRHDLRLRLASPAIEDRA